MKRSDRIKLTFTRNWNLPGRERLANWLRPSDKFKKNLAGGIVWLAGEDIAIYTTADSFIEWAILSTGTYEEEVGKMIKLSLNEGSVAIDIGANIGLQSIRMAQRVGPNGSVFAFEPLNYLQEKFKRNMSLNRVENVKLFPYALSNEELDTEFKINRNTWNQGTFSISGPGTGTEAQNVNIRIGDEIQEINNLTRLDLIKIDVEGFEFQVLNGLKKTIERHTPRIIFEYDPNYWHLNAQNIDDCFHFLRSLNYMVYQINTACCQPINDPFEIEEGNLFCIQEN